MRPIVIILLIILVLAILLIIGGRVYNSNMATPAGVGVGELAPCPDSPNCVSTLATVDQHKIEPLALTQSPTDAISSLAEIMVAMPKSRVITKNKTYLHVEMRSSLWNFVDDVEFLVDEENGVINSRSAARMGYSDMGVNKARYEKISAEFLSKSP